MCRERLGKMNNAEAYSIAVLRNLFKDRYRKSDSLIPDVSPEDLPLTSEDDIGKRIEQSEASDQVKQLIAQLPLQQRQIITMHDLEERSYDEIAGLTELTVNNIRVLLSRARKTIRQQFRI
jgi:RNA polymerase sigma-70 factor (ECF subfamily)